jgi:lysophospholipase L1-like esterase
MLCRTLLRSLKSALTPGRAGRDRRAATRPRRGRSGLEIETLEDRSLPSATITIAAMGDSLTAPYAGQPWGAAGDQSWAQQLAAQGYKHLEIDNLAVAGATSASLLAQGQDTAVAALAAEGAVRYAVLIVGANDVEAHLGDFLQGDPAPFAQGVVANVETALLTVAAAGDVRLAVGTVPDVTLTPSFQQLIPPGSPLQQEIAGAIAAANVQIEGFAAAEGMPVIDLAGLGRLAEAPLVVGGAQVPNFYAPDGFHPATVPQGLLGNAVLEAFAAAYDPRIARFRLTDQQLLDEAGIPHGPGHSYFDVSPYVLVPDRHGCAGLAGALGLGGGGPALAASAPAAGTGFHGASGPLLTDPGSFLLPANTVSPRTASGDVWGAPWHAAGGPWGGTEALDRLFAVGGLAPAVRGG